MMLETKDLILRDFIESDIEKRIYWETEETEWQLWDAPWEYEGLTEQEKEEELRQYIANMHKWVEHYKNISEDAGRHAFQIVTKGAEQRYIGWVSSYRIDEQYSYIDGEGYCTVGIDIPDTLARGKGYAYQALGVFIEYLHSQGEEDIYTQTWSGNQRMIHIAEKMGFVECGRKVGIRMVRGNVYDGLTFKLDREKFSSFMKTMD